MSESIDIATALDTTLRHPTIEAKFQKLRLHSAQKIKSLLGTVENQTKKLKEYRGAPSDGRTATIKALKAKLRDQEFVADVLKEDVVALKNTALELAGEKPRCNIKAMNQDVINETIGGPKRFRQLTREEIENNLTELEMLEKQYREQPATDKKLTSRQRAAAKNAAAAQHVGNQEESLSARNRDSPDYRLSEMQRKQQESELREQESRLQQIQEDIDHIRASNSKQKVKKENLVLISKDYEELTISMNRMDVTLKDVLERLRESKKELSAIKEKQHTDADTMVASIERAKKECNASYAENRDLLIKMKTIEDELDRAMHGKLIGDDAEEARSASRQSDEELEELEEKLRRQLFDCMERKKGLQERVDTIPSLRETLRTKNDEYRELKRDTAEVARRKLPADKVKNK